MSADISIVIGVFGDDVKAIRHWIDIAQRAVRSVRNQTVSPCGFQIAPGKTLHEARNRGAEEATGRWLLFLDADDELDPGYIEAMQAAIDQATANNPDGTFLFGPATLGIRPDGVEDAEPILIPERPLTQGNYLVIGTVVERSHFLEVGGFQDWPAWEDWALWLRCVGAGAQVIRVPDAIYRVHVSPNSRNESAANDRRLFRNILNDYTHWMSHR